MQILSQGANFSYTLVATFSSLLDVKSASLQTSFG